MCNITRSFATFINKFKQYKFMMKKIKLMSGIIIAIIFVSLIIAYLSNSLVFLGLCKPGDKIGGGLGPGFCYTPSSFAGKPCDKATDCGTGECVLADPNRTTGKGICQDLPFGCNVWIDENGKFDESAVLCVD